MERDLNDAVVTVFDLILTVCHGIALVVLIVGNVLLYEQFTSELTQNSGFLRIAGIHGGLSIAFIIVYCSAAGVVSVFLSMNRSLQRLVALHEGRETN